VTPKVLFVVNDPVSTEAMLADAFAARGFDVETFDVVPLACVDHPAIDVTFPDPLSYDVIVPLGARWPVYDDALRRSWVEHEMRLVRDADAAGVGVLAICFGGQLVAQAHGGSVSRSAHPEIGWHQVDSDDFDLVSEGPWFQWHFDSWTLPSGAIEIARNEQASQAFVLGHTLALQFHPELDAALLKMWLDDDRDGEAAKLGVDPAELLSRTAELRDGTAQRVRALVRGFLEKIAKVASSRCRDPAGVPAPQRWSAGRTGDPGRAAGSSAGR
jgi:GMP synthase-like glutamine amidotransferase